MTTKIGISGFGRIGRLVARAAIMDPEVEIVAINSTADPENTARLFKYDSTHGTFQGDVSFDDSHLIVNGKSIPLFSDRDPKNLKWGLYGTEIVIDSTGAFRTIETAGAHLGDTVKKVIITAPSSDAQMIVMGVNQEAYDPSQPVVSNASCTTNCLAPVTKVIHDNFTIEAAAMTTVHAFTNDQNNLDNRHKDPRRARGCTQSIVPTSTGAAKAMGKVIPALNGKMNGFSVRVPTPNVSLVDVVFQLKESPSVEEVNALLKAAAEGELKGILGFSDEPLVSIDYNGDSRSSIVDGLSTMKVGDHLIKVVAWYDNEWGYSVRCVDLAKYIHKH
ncbi:MAG: type I glyceraldehyde-3-phosphate dehydrogenase [Chloroflexi bacterium]|jgi:glyceraldehyde 3-phosphate dehydrogenase|nr:type I glyceraldehyde-3-phosphate dehydrogenase [Chloroflexota bacterium]